MRDPLARSVARLLRWARAAPFHAERFRTLGIGAADIVRAPLAVLATLPPLCKSELRAAGPAALYGGRMRRFWRSSRSSGSSGEPFRVYYDPAAWLILRHWVKLRARFACGLRPHHRLALLDAAAVRAPRTVLEHTGRIRRISVLQPAETIAAALAEFAPDAVYGLPSALLEAAHVLETRSSRVHPSFLFTSGELLSPRARDALAKAYRAPVFDVYGTSETKEIAWECPVGARHVNADVLHLEVLRDDGTTAGRGEEGDLVVTLLVNRAMPLLRYHTGDRGVLGAGSCGCGRATPLLQVVTGRATDVIELDGGRRLSQYVLTCALERVAGLAQYRVKQVGRNELSVRIEAAPGRDFDTVATAVRAILGQELTTVRVDVAPLEPSLVRGKLRAVEGLRAEALGP